MADTLTPETPTALLAWASLTPDQRSITLHAMSRFGGGFVGRLAEAWKRADQINANCLGEAFPDLLERYGPGSAAYAAAAQREASA